MKFNIIAAVDLSNGIGFNNTIPWLNDYSDLVDFKKITTECDSQQRLNVVIMGKNTWVSLNKKALPNRLNIIISSTLTDSYNSLVFKNLETCLETLKEQYFHKINKIFIIGGEQLYNEAIAHPMCHQIYLTKIPGHYICDKYFPVIDTEVYQEMPVISEKDGMQFHIYEKIKQFNMEEYQYIKLIKRIIYSGTTKDDRTKIGTFSVFGNQMRFNLQNNNFPLLTTKKVFLRGIIEELLWFINGSTDAKLLSQKNVKIWDANGSREFLDNLGFTDREEGDLGPVYGFQWRNWGAEYIDNKSDYNNKGIDQLSNLIEEIKKNPTSRRLILSAWNVADIPKMALPPCHILCQFYVADGKLSAQLYQRSGDVGLGVPFNIASYALLLKMVAFVTGYEPADLVYTLGDAHIYNNHIDALKKQITRIPRDFPKLYITNTDSIKNITDFTIDNFDVQNYKPHSNIKMEMAV